MAEYNHERDSNQVPVRLETLDRINKEFQHAQSEVEMFDSERFEEHIEVRTVFKDKYCATKGFLLTFLRELVTQQSLCWNCLRPGHQARACRLIFSCRFCQARHHSLLHDQSAITPSPFADIPIISSQRSVRSAQAKYPIRLKSAWLFSPTTVRSFWKRWPFSSSTKMQRNASTSTPRLSIYVEFY